MAAHNISEDIEVLSKKLIKDPASRLFLPLAEKYRDAGMLEEAEIVLRDGLKHHPDYVGAHFSLGRVLHEKGDTDGAFGIFREVVRSAPDNLLAHKKLAEIAIKKDLIPEALAWWYSLTPAMKRLGNFWRDTIHLVKSLLIPQGNTA